MTANPFAAWLIEVSADTVVVRPDDVVGEATANLWSFALSREQAEVVSVRDVVEFACQVEASRRKWLLHHNRGPMTLYWWHDEMAGQLRFSLVSSVHKTLPFGCNVVAAESIEAIAEDWLSSPYLFGLPVTSNHSEYSEPSENRVYTLPVWAVQVP